MADLPVRPSNTQQAADEAAFWCMRMNEESCSDEDRRAFEHWLARDPSHALEYRAMLEIWTASDDLPRPGRRSTGIRIELVAAASVLLAIALGWFFGVLPHAFQRYSAEDEVRVVTLSDGSRVQLNRATSLTYLSFRDRRQVRLGEGEAFFDVRHLAAHPFVVKAEGGSVVVTGTRFNVWTYGGDVVVTLQEGAVKVIGGGSGRHSVELSPGQQARYGEDNEIPKVTVANPAEAFAWREGKLVIRDLSLAEALPLINRYLPRPALLGDRATGELRIGGTFKTDDVLGLVMRLPKVLPVRLERNESGNIVIQHRDRAAAD